MRDDEGIPSVLSVREARDQLCELLRISRELAEAADPVYFGAHRQPEAVLLSVEKFMELARWADRGLEFKWYFEPDQD